MNAVVETPGGLRKVDPNSLVARAILAFLATAGLFYVNIMPAIVDGLQEGLGFTEKQAGYVASANIYGAAVGALIIVFLIHRLRWRPMAYSMLVILLAIDLLSMLIVSPPVMIAVRFVHGFIGGALIGVAFSVIARTLKPDRTFGVLLVVQFGLGGLGNLYLPRLVPHYGVDVLFMSLIAFSLVTALMLPFLPDYHVKETKREAHEPLDERIKIGPLALTLLAIFLFQAGNMALFAFIIDLGEFYTLDREFITWTLLASGWIGIVGAMIVIAMHTRYGRFAPLMAAMVLTAIGLWVLHYSGNRSIFFIANCGMGITWAFVMAYLLGLCSEFDKAGRMAALGGFASKFGLATGPFVAGQILGGDNYGLLINVGVAVILLSMVACAVPALVQDRAAVREADAETATL